MLLAIVGGTVWFLPPYATVLVACAVAWLGALELAHLSRQIGVDTPAGWLGASAAAVCAAWYVPSGLASGADAIVAVLCALVLAIGAMSLASGPPGAATLPRAAIGALAPIYLGLPLGAIAWVRAVHGPRALTALAIILVVSDSGQYFVGRALGRRKLAPAVSPAKTVEGAAGGVLAAALAAAALGPVWIAPMSAMTGAVLGVTIALVGILGDLFESALKRGAGVKDSSTLIPGHGGVLDRIDSWLFAAPVYYVLLRYVL